MSEFAKTVVEDENGFLKLLSENILTIEDLRHYNRQLNDRGTYHHSVVVAKLNQLKQRHKLFHYRINTETYGSLKWDEYERILEASYEKV